MEQSSVSSLDYEDLIKDPDSFFHAYGFEQSLNGLFFPTPVEMNKAFQPVKDEVKTEEKPERMLRGTKSRNKRARKIAKKIAKIPRRDDDVITIGEYTKAERRGKIERFLEKRKRRNFEKKIQLECRQKVANSRPRIGGRFI
jgi:hypothetical protein